MGTNKETFINLDIVNLYLYIPFSLQGGKYVVNTDDRLIRVRTLETHSAVRSLKATELPHRKIKMHFLTLIL